MLQVAEGQALCSAGKGDAGLQLLGVLGAHLQIALHVQGLDALVLFFHDRLGGGGLGLLHALQAGDVLVDGGHFGFEGVEGFGLLGVQGHAFFGGLGHQGFHVGSLGDAGCFELRDLFSDGFHVVALLGLRRLDGFGGTCRSAGRGYANDRSGFLAKRGPLLLIEGLDRGDACFCVGRNGHGAELVPSPLGEVDATAVDEAVFLGAEADGKPAD
ncbi:hypothetical protein FQZ97_683230 [compost metagenome]